MPNYIDLEFADGEYRFALPIKQIEELQRKCNAGIGAIFARVIAGAVQLESDIVLSPGNAAFYASDLIETIRHGLIGGQMGKVNGSTVEVKPPDANRMIDAYVMDQPFTYSWELAVAILGACIVGYDPPGKKESAAASETPDQMDDSITD